jgi:hypothetical protein
VAPVAAEPVLQATAAQTDAAPPAENAHADAPPVGSPLAPQPSPLAHFVAKLGPLRQKVLEGWVVVREQANKVRQKLPPMSVLLSSSRPKWVLPALAGAGLVVGVGLMMIVVHGGGSQDESPNTPMPSAATSATSAAAASATESSRAPVAAPSAVVAPPPPKPTPAPAVACKITGAPHTLAGAAVLAAGVEAVRLGDDIAFGFAADEHEGVAIRADAASLEVKGSAKGKSPDPLRRATPGLRNGGTLSLLLDGDRKNDHLQGRRTVLTSTPLQLGASDGSLVWAHLSGPAAGKLWALDGAAPVDALRSSVDEGGLLVAIAYRRNGAVWVGAAEGDGSLAPKGDLAQMNGLGPVVGSPAVAISGGKILAAWADRASSGEPWHLRWTHFAAGEAAGGATDFQTPAGGKGENVISPSVAALPGGRFLLVWTEGPASEHDVRALTVTGDGAPLGGPLAISSAGVNAGAGQAAVNASGKGAVAFLSAAGDKFEVTATPIDCGP